jgi:ABC-type transporter Mla subunit MlaD
LDSLKLPLTRRTLVDEEQLLSQLLRVERSIPETVQAAERILRTKEEILARANDYAQELIKSAEQRAAQIADEVRIVQQAEMEAQQIRQQLQEETEALRQRNFAEVERIRRQTQQELEEMRRAALAECEQIQAGADTYADRVLTDMERQLSEMLRVIHNGRQHLRGATPQQRPPE